MSGEIPCCKCEIKILMFLFKFTSPRGNYLLMKVGEAVSVTAERKYFCTSNNKRGRWGYWEGVGLGRIYEETRGKRRRGGHAIIFLKKEEQCFSVNFKPGDPFSITVTSPFVLQDRQRESAVHYAFSLGCFTVSAEWALPVKTDTWCVTHCSQLDLTTLSQKTRCIIKSTRRLCDSETLQSQKCMLKQVSENCE